jgi:hypothetical protein
MYRNIYSNYGYSYQWNLGQEPYTINIRVRNTRITWRFEKWYEIFNNQNLNKCMAYLKTLSEILQWRNHHHFGNRVYFPVDQKFIEVPQLYIIKTRLRTGRSGIRIPVGANRPDRLWGPPTPLFNEYRRSFPRLKRPGREVFHSSQSSSEIKNEWIYTSTPPLCFHGVDRVNFTLYIL